MNKELKSRIEGLEPGKVRPATKNLSGHEAVAYTPFERLLEIVCTSMVRDEFYKSANQQLVDLQSVIRTCVKIDPYFTAQCIVYARAKREMRTITQVAAAMLAIEISGQPFAKDFFSRWNKKTGTGGIVYRLDDMTTIQEVYAYLSKVKMSAAMKKGFKSVLESATTYDLLKYKKTTIDISNLVHPNSSQSKAIVEYEGGKLFTLDAVLKGLPIKAETWETAQSEAGQLIAEAKKAGKIDEATAESMLNEAKADNWAQLIAEGKLGTFAALRNIRSILLTNPSADVIKGLCAILSDGPRILASKILPWQFDIAREVILSEFNNAASRSILSAVEAGLMAAIPNMAEVLPGSTLVIVDQSGSMHRSINMPGMRSSTSCSQKARSLAAMFAKGLNADIIRFGTRAERVHYNGNDSLSTIADRITKDMSTTSLASALTLIINEKARYDRIIVLSDNECNHGSQWLAYKSYLSIANPYVYSIDMNSNGTTMLQGDKVKYLFGYGLGIFTEMVLGEFKGSSVIDEVRQIKFKS